MSIWEKIKIRKVSTNIKIPDRKEVYIFLFYVYVFIMPFTKIGIPAFGLYEFTIGDFTLFGLIGMSFFIKAPINRSNTVFMYLFLFCLSTFLFSLPFIKSFTYYFLEALPFVFAIFIVLGLNNFLSLVDDHARHLKNIMYILLLSVFITTLPVYYQIITGIEPSYFYDSAAWRYTFLTENPNQFGSYTLLYIVLISIYSIKTRAISLFKLLIFMLTFMPAAFYSGSKTVAVVSSLLLLMITIANIWYASFTFKVTFLPILIVIVVLNGPTLLDKLAETGGQVSRSLSIFETLIAAQEGKAKVLKGSDSGNSIDEAKALFWKYPIAGVGLGNKPMHSAVVTEIHNTFYKILAEAGIIGFIGFGLVFFMPLIILLVDKSSLFDKFLFIYGFIALILMNYAWVIYRQRWFWLFMFLLYVVSRVDKKGYLRKSRLSFLN